MTPEAFPGGLRVSPVCTMYGPHDQSINSDRAGGELSDLKKKRKTHTDKSV